MFSFQLFKPPSFLLVPFFVLENLLSPFSTFTSRTLSVLQTTETGRAILVAAKSTAIFWQHVFTTSKRRAETGKATTMPFLISLTGETFTPTAKKGE